MAIAKGVIQMTGGVKGLSFYTIAGTDKVIVRTKGGPSARRIKEGKEFAELRTHQQEWSGCIKFSQSVKKALGETYRLADYNVSPVLNGMGKNLMKLDTEHIVGERLLRLSAYKQALENFNLNRNFAFNAVLRINPTLEINRETLTATVAFPRFNSGTDLLNIQRLPYFRLIVCIGTVSDMKFEPSEYGSCYFPAQFDLNGCSASAITEWLSANDQIAEQKLTVSLESLSNNLSDNVTVIVSAGIEFGNVGFAGQIAEVKRAGCAKILGVG